MGITLRPYQVESVEACFNWLANNDGNPLLVIPTGGGKSLIMGTLVQRALESSFIARVLIVAHRKELISQNIRAVASLMPLAQIGTYSAGLKSKDTTSPIIVGGIQSIARNPYAIGAFDYILLDEAHLVPNNDDTLYRKFITAAKQMNPKVRFVGLTATPFRLSSGVLHRGKDALFNAIAYDVKISDLIESGYLCPLISRATVARLSTDGVAVRGGEFAPGALELAVDKVAITEAAVEEMCKLFADRNKWLIFCSGVQHAEHVAESLQAHGIAASAVHGSLTDEQRAHRLSEFTHGRIRAITSMDVLTTGYDEPAIDAIALMRPTKSTGLYCQMVGRGFRLHPSKKNTLVLDFAENVQRHGPVDAISVDQFKDKGSSEGMVPTKECPNCGNICLLAARVCKECNHAFPEPETVSLVATASMLPIMSGEEVPEEWHAVNSVEYYYHEPKDEGKKPSLRVEYYIGFRRIASEWICFEHSGFARQKAVHWWAQRSADPPPDTIDEALLLCEADGFPIPSEIATKPDGKYTRIVAQNLPPVEALAMTAKACWTCAYFTKEEHCRRYDAKPPEAFHSSGCDNWKEEALPF